MKDLVAWTYVKQKQELYLTNTTRLGMDRIIPMTEIRADAFLKRRVRAWLAERLLFPEDPWRVARLCLNKAVRTWTPLPNWDGAQAWHYKLASAGTYVPVMLLMLYGAWTFRHRWREVYLLLVPALYIACLHSIFMGSIRYRLPAMPCLMILAAAGLVRWLERSAKSADA